MNKNTLVIGGAVIFKDVHGRYTFLLVKQKDEAKWSLPKVTARRGESSVRSVLRLTSEVSGMNVRVLDEAGRYFGTQVVNGKTVEARYFYYITLLKSAGEIMGFDQFKWMDYATAVKKLELKREVEMVKNTREYLKEWDKKGKKRNIAQERFHEESEET